MANRSEDRRVGKKRRLTIPVAVGRPGMDSLDRGAPAAVAGIARGCFAGAARNFTERAEAGIFNCKTNLGTSNGENVVEMEMT